MSRGSTMPDFMDAHAETQRLLNDQAAAVLAYKKMLTDRARAKGQYKTQVARRVLKARDEGEKSVAAAETVASADGRIAELYMEHLMTEALTDGQIEHIRELRQRAEYGRSVIADARAADNLHARGVGGAA